MLPNSEQRFSRSTSEVIMCNKRDCARCGQTTADSADWYDDLCPSCADETDGFWVCVVCGRRGLFEDMAGDGARKPVCCGAACEHEDFDGPEAVDNDRKPSARPPAYVRQFQLVVPTYYGTAQAMFEMEKEEFDDPYAPVLIHEADGVRVVLGTHDYNDMDKPDIQIERRPNGWAIFLHPLGGGDPSGYVYFLDDGRSYVVPEGPSNSTPPIEYLERIEQLPDLDQPKSNVGQDFVDKDADRPQHVIESATPED